MLVSIKSFVQKSSLMVFLFSAMISGIAWAKDTQVGLKGYCPVTMLTQEKAQAGDPQLSAAYEGVAFHFANTEAKKMFLREPQRYASAIQYRSSCAATLAFSRKQIESDPQVFLVINSKIYLFADDKSRKLFLKDKDSNIVKADQAWKKFYKPAEHIEH